MESLGFLGSFGGRRGFWGWGSPSLVREGGPIVGLGMEFLGGGSILGRGVFGGRPIAFWGVFGERPYRWFGMEFLGRGRIAFWGVFGEKRDLFLGSFWREARARVGGGEGERDHGLGDGRPYRARPKPKKPSFLDPLYLDTDILVKTRFLTRAVSRSAQTKKTSLPFT